MGEEFYCYCGFVFNSKKDSFDHMKKHLVLSKDKIWFDLTPAGHKCPICPDRVFENPKEAKAHYKEPYLHSLEEKILCGIDMQVFYLKDPETIAMIKDMYKELWWEYSKRIDKEWKKYCEKYNVDEKIG